MGRTSRLTLPFPSRTEWMLSTLGLAAPASPHSGTMVQRDYPPYRKCSVDLACWFGLGKLAVPVVSCGQGRILWRATFRPLILLCSTSTQDSWQPYTSNKNDSWDFALCYTLGVPPYFAASFRKKPRFVAKCICCARWFRKDLALLIVLILWRQNLGEIWDSLCHIVRWVPAENREKRQVRKLVSQSGLSTSEV
jgi:hypothetical protein